MTSPLHPTPLLNRPKLLQDPDRRMSHLCQRKVLSETNSWATVEGDICPGDRDPGFPSGRIEVVDSGSEKIFSSLHTHCGVRNFGAGCDGDWLRISEVILERYLAAVGPTAGGESGVN